MLDFSTSTIAALKGHWKSEVVFELGETWQNGRRQHLRVNALREARGSCLPHPTEGLQPWISVRFNPETSGLFVTNKYLLAQLTSRNFTHYRTHRSSVTFLTSFAKCSRHVTAHTALGVIGKGFRNLLWFIYFWWWASTVDCGNHFRSLCKYGYLTPAS